MNDSEWIEAQGDCCIHGCDNKALFVDNMDNVFCDECADQNIEEEPENWV